MKFSNLQENIFNAIIYTEHDVCVNAAPGSGKTTTIVEASRRVAPSLASLFLAFNKGIVTELTEKLPPHVECSTLHSKGMKALIKTYGKLAVSESKTFFLSEHIINKKSGLNEKKKIILRLRLQDLMNYARLHLVDKTKEAFETICIRYGLDYDDEFIQDGFEMWDYLKEYNERFRYGSNQIDYTDMIYLPVTDEDVLLDSYDVIFVDEGQDLNKLQHTFVRMMSEKGRVILVGDKNQAIYAFCGADIDSFINFENSNNTVSLPLSISYRCPKLVVEKAQEVYKSIDPFEDQEQGIVRNGIPEEIKDGDFVLCRNVRPLVLMFFRLLERGLKAEIKGHEVLEAIKREIKAQIAHDVDKGVDKMLEKLGRIHEELKKKNIKSPLKHPKFVNHQEKIQIVRHLINCTGVRSMRALFQEFNSMLEAKGTIKLMTIHKSKGLENDRIFLIERFEGKRLIPSQYATTPAQLRQENNLLFVAYTRSMKELITIPNFE